MCVSYTHPSIFVFDCIVLCVECCLIGQVVFLADHGNDMGAKEMWKTESWIEKTHPFLTMVVPQALLDRIPGAQDTLTKNTQRLVRAVVMIHVGFWLYSLCNVQCSNPNMYNLGCRRCRAFVCLFFYFSFLCYVVLLNIYLHFFDVFSIRTGHDVRRASHVFVDVQRGGRSGKFERETNDGADENI